MRKICLLLLSQVLCYSLLAQHITNYQIVNAPVNTCTPITVNIMTDSLNNHPDSLNIETYWGDLNHSHDYIHNDITGPTAYAHHLYDFGGTYTIKHVLLKGNSPYQRIDSISYSYQYPNCKTFHMRLYYDINANCLFDNGDVYPSVPTIIRVDSANTPIDTFTVTSGFYYHVFAPVGTIYKFTAVPTALGQQFSCPATGVITDTINAIVNDTTTKYFAFTCNGTPGFDLAEQVTSKALAHQFTATILVSNSLCQTQNATLTCNFSPKYSFHSASPAPANISGNTITWNFNNISLLNPAAVNVTLAPLVVLTAGDTVHSSYYLTPIAGDLDTINNIVIHEDTIAASYDPNYKEPTPSGSIAAGVKLTYTIEFENTGNDTARNIYILDTLSSNVLPHTLDIVTSSAAMDFGLYKIATGQYVAKFDFPNINLLDSSHHDSCTGMVVYTIDTRSDLPIGTYVPNRAGIYFDDNEVVMTNTAVNRIGAPQSVTTLSNKPGATLYPNPVNDILTISTDTRAYNSLEINNTMGQLMIKQNVTKADTKVNVKNLPSGIYTITLKGDAGTKTLKFEKL